MTYLERYQVVPLVLILWAMTLVTLTVLKLLSLMDKLDLVSSGVATAIIGILTAALAFYVRNRELTQAQLALKDKEIQLVQAQTALRRNL